MKHPELKEVYGHWLGPSVGIGPAMTSKILKQTGQVLNLSTFHGLNKDEIADSGEQELQKDFNMAIEQCLGKPMSVKDLNSIGIDTPEYALYANDDQGLGYTPQILMM